MKKKAGDTQPEGTADKDENVIGIWPIEVGVHRVAWNSGGGMSRAPLLASGMACGLVRIDWLVGRFWRDRIPRVSIELMRGETAGNDSDGKMDQDSDAA